MKKTAVVLLNLGGPDSLAAVEPFLFNLFNDRAIIGLAQPWRRLLAKLLARRRAPAARAIYRRLGGVSPLFANTAAQPQALQAELGTDHRVFVAMRYWPPYAADAAAALRDWQPAEVVLLPLYPQFSTTTTASSFAAWQAAAAALGLDLPTRMVCCYPEDTGFIGALVTEIRRALEAWPAGERVRLLFSVHGLPQKTVAAGDPYPWQVERTAAALRAALGAAARDSIVCYQSRVGPLRWIGPATDAEIRRAGAERLGLVVVPIAFVSEHSETLVELDLEYRHLAAAHGVPRYVRVPTVAASPAFIAGLARLVRTAGGGPCPATGTRLCPPAFAGCLCAAAAEAR